MVTWIREQLPNQCKMIPFDPATAPNPGHRMTFKAPDETLEELDYAKLKVNVVKALWGSRKCKSNGKALSGSSMRKSWGALQVPPAPPPRTPWPP